MSAYRSDYLVPRPTKVSRHLSRRMWRFGLPRRWPRVQVIVGLSSWLMVIAVVSYTTSHHTFQLPASISSGTALAASASGSHAAPVNQLASGPVGGVLPPGTYAPYGTYANTYTRGQCTWYVASRRPVPNGWGNANSWYSHARAAGWSVGTTPAVGAIAWTSAGYFGHVAIVEAVSGTSVEVTEMNYYGTFHIDDRWTSASSFRYIY